MTLREASALDEDLRAAAASLLKVLWRRQPVGGIGLVLSNLQPTGPQMPLFPLVRQDGSAATAETLRVRSGLRVLVDQRYVSRHGTGRRGQPPARVAQQRVAATSARRAVVRWNVSCRCGSAGPARAAPRTVRGKLSAMPGSPKRARSAPTAATAKARPVQRRTGRRSRPAKPGPSSSGSTASIRTRPPSSTSRRPSSSSSPRFFRRSRRTPASIKSRPPSSSGTRFRSGSPPPRRRSSSRRSSPTGFFRQKSKMLLGMAQACSNATADRCRPTWTR